MRPKSIRSDYIQYHYPSIYQDIEERVRVNRTIYSMKRCFHSVCSWYGVRADELKSKSREQHIAIPRHHFCWVVYRNRLDVSYPMLGRYLNRDHTTIVHSVDTFERMKDALRKEVLGVDKLIKECKLR